MSDMQQSDGINARAILWTGVAIVIAIAFAIIAAYFGWTKWRAETSPTAPNVPMDFRVVGAKLESAPQADYAAYLTEKEQLLKSYQWIDERAGIARIPIEDAMRMMSQTDAARPPVKGNRR